MRNCFDFRVISGALSSVLMLFTALLLDRIGFATE